MYIVKNNYKDKYLNDSTDEQSIAIIKEEMDNAYKDLTIDILHGNIPTIDAIKNKGIEATKKSIQRICVQGAANEVSKYTPYLIGAAALLTIYLIAK